MVVFGVVLACVGVGVGVAALAHSVAKVSHLLVFFAYLCFGVGMALSGAPLVGMVPIIFSAPIWWSLTSRCQQQFDEDLLGSRSWAWFSLPVMLWSVAACLTILIFAFSVRRGDLDQGLSHLANAYSFPLPPWWGLERVSSLLNGNSAFAAAWPLLCGVLLVLGCVGIIVKPRLDAILVSYSLGALGLLVGFGWAGLFVNSGEGLVNAILLGVCNVCVVQLGTALRAKMVALRGHSDTDHWRALRGS